MANFNDFDKKQKKMEEEINEEGNKGGIAGENDESQNKEDEE